MTLEQAITLFVLMLVAQIPLLIAALINYLKSRSNTQAIKEVHEKATEAATAAITAVSTAETHAQKLEEKLDLNTNLTEQVKTAAEAVSEHTGACNDEINRLSKMAEDHHLRIAALEVQMASVKLAIDGVSKNVDSTRHEMRGHMQGIVNKLDLLSVVRPAEKT
jgi:predicted  nucleic acid-binding Zn-ribbon protein